VRELSMCFGGIHAVSDLSFDVNAGGVTAIIGPNGAGKTTVFNCLTGFYKPSRGSILLHRERHVHALHKMDDFRIAREAGVLRTFQNTRLFPGMSVLENMLVAQHDRLSQASGFSLKGLLRSASFTQTEKQAVEKARHWLEKVGLISQANDAAGNLSYGARRRLEIARAGVRRPVLLCLDEPAAGLNHKETENLNLLLRHLCEEEAITLLLIEHDMNVVMKISDHVIVLDQGLSIAEGSPAQIREDPDVIRAYLGMTQEARP
jgi:branched-chain amino acid transport system ATP-binding protein